MRTLVLCAPILVATVACGDPPPKAPHTQEMVPANSLDEAKLHGAESPSLLDEPASPASEPAKPVEAASSEPPTKGRIGKAECGRAMDHYLELEITTNPQLKGLPPEVVEQAKQQAREQHGEAPCTATPAQYRCAMAAKTTAAWQKCMK